MLPGDRGGPVAERLAAVLCEGHQGSGYLLSPRVVLTAAHVVAHGSDIRVVVPGGPGPVRCERVWRHEDVSCDATLLLAEGPLTGDTPDRAWNRWGSVQGVAPLPGGEAIGFPYVQRDGGGRLESEHVTGTVKPGSALLGQAYVLDIDKEPAPRPDGGSPWAGFSGTALFGRGLLIGVVTADAEGWRHGRLKATPVGKLLEDASFLATLAEFGCPAPDIVDVSGPVSDPDAEFEERYAAYVRDRHSRLTIYGIDLNHDREWSLDASYLSLEARPAQRRSRTDRAVPLPADQALAGRDRVLLRGVAGSGKTTLVQWLAVAAAGGRAGGDLTYLKGRVPFVLPLRHIARGGSRLPLPEGFLTAVGCPLAGSQPSCWTDRVLTRGRGLLLVDGIDEIPEPDRERIRRWLRDLIIAYPDNLWLVTSRPSAVHDDWLTGDGFAELSLAPMDRDAITEFVERWHTATGADPALARRLLTSVHTKKDLAALATNPLMCALICALHREREGYLPHGRKELYEAALSMLLERREQQKGLSEAFGIQLTQAPQIKLLQKLAYWMIRNQQAEIQRSRAQRIVSDAIPAVPQVARLDVGAREVLDHLLLRSGLLREPEEGAIDFVHRTFQDFLAARAAVEEEDFGLLVDNADKTQWEDVIRMAVAHARPRESAALLMRLVELGDQSGDRRIHLLAMACLEHAAELDQEVRRTVEDRASRIIPPRTIEESDALIKVGPIVLELLPGPEELTEWEAGYVLETAAGIAHDAALPLLARFCEAPWTRVRERVVDAWSSFDTARYAQEVLAHLPADDILTVRTAAQLTALRELGRRPRLRLRGDFDEALLSAAGPHPSGSPYELVLSMNSSLRSLDFLKEWVGLRRLVLSNCPNIRSVDALAALPDLEHFSADEPGRLPVLQEIDRWPALRSLALGTDNSPSCAADWEAIQGHPSLENLTISARSLTCLLPRQVITGLRQLTLVGSLPYGHFAARPGQFPNVSILALGGDIRDEAAGVHLFPRFPALKQLIVRKGTALTGLDRLSGVVVLEDP
ncbi:NACHT domain-containing protein [Streptomyces griseorubiginosus]|uniref:NACHT domain-containing protein n=1 Tax=Streptomyces griseorubiginosus TaxID=67304 RepID=UPI0033B1F9D3